MLVSERDIFNFPPPLVDKKCVTGIIPIDFYLERQLEIGLHWFRTTQDAPNEVFGHLIDEFLNDKYGQPKIDEIAKYIRETEIDVKQSFPMEDEEVPSISINLQSSMEIPNYVALDKHAGQIPTLGSDGSIKGSAQLGYTPIRDDVLIGIHATGSPDKVKYLYYLVTYIINAFREQLEDRPDKINSLFNISWRATDISRLNEYLPTHLFSRFVTVTADHYAIFNKVPVPFINNFDVRVDVDVDEGG